MPNDRLETLLLEHEVVTREQLEQAKKQQKSTGDPIDASFRPVRQLPGALVRGVP